MKRTYTFFKLQCVSCKSKREELYNKMKELAFELGYKACEHGMNIIEARERLTEIQAGTRKPINFFEGYRKEK